jgi:hypothetical protein
MSMAHSEAFPMVMQLVVSCLRLYIEGARLRYHL